MEFRTDVGAGLYTGDFRDHLIADGAYTATPIVDEYIASYFTGFLGLQFQAGCGSVIHRASQPIEGVLLYMSLGPFFKWEISNFYTKVWANFGFQQPTMTLQWYGSGFFELGGGGGIKLTDSGGLFLGIKYRRQFLQSIIIHEKYDSIESNDNLSSISLTLGWETRLY